VSASIPERRPLLRAGLAAVVVIDLVWFYFSLSEARALADGAALGGLSELLSRPAAAALVIAVGVAGAVAFAARPGRLWHGAAALAALVLLSTAHTQLYGSPWRHLFYSGLCLAGWLLGLAVRRRHGEASDESYARVGSIALLGAAYFNAGISKIAFGGFDWVSGLPIQAVIVAQDGLVADSALSAYRVWVVMTPAVAALFSVLTVVFELAAPLMIAGRRMRLCVAFGLLAMHFNIYLLTPILYWESMALLLLFGFSADGAEETAPADSARDRRFMLAAAVLGVCALIAIAHQASRFARSRGVSSPIASPPPGSAAEAQPPITDDRSPITKPRRIGPLAVSENLTADWMIDALTVTGSRIVVALAGRHGRVRFEVTCDPGPGSPFDVGEARVLYSQHTEFALLEGAGRELQRRLRAAAEGTDICGRLAQWSGDASDR
jgi:hypothetical protein